MTALHGRRRAGLLLVLAVLVVAVVLPRSQPRSIAGSPVPAAVPGPPSIGSCVASPAGGWNAGRPVRGALTYPPAATQRCTDRRSGEVIALLPAGQVARPSPPSSAVPDPDRNADRCATELNGYLGLMAADSPVAQTAWQPLSTVSTTVAGPTPLQRAFGQHWLSCIAYVAGTDGNGVSYDRSLRAGYTSGRLPRSAAQCLRTPDPQLMDPVPCSTPHQAELFGRGWSATPVTALTPTCRELVRHLTGMPDPTAGGALTIETAQQRLQVVTIGADGTSSPLSSTGETSVPLCLVAVAAHHQLAGPLVDLGSAPVPWA